MLGRSTFYVNCIWKHLSSGDLYENSSDHHLSSVDLYEYSWDHHLSPVGQSYLTKWSDMHSIWYNILNYFLVLFLFCQLSKFFGGDIVSLATEQNTPAIEACSLNGVKAVEIARLFGVSEMMFWCQGTVGNDVELWVPVLCLCHGTDFYI